MTGIIKPVRLVIFDLGSTLIYENEAWDGYFPRADQALWNALQRAGVTIPISEVFAPHQGIFDLYYDLHRNDLNEPSTIAVLGDLLRKKGFDLPRETLRSALREMFAVTQQNWLPEADAIETLTLLRAAGIHRALISNASDDDNTQALIDKGGFRPYLELIVSSASFGKRKPDPSIFSSVLDHFKVPPEQAVMVGDDYEADVQGAHNTGMQSIWITRRAFSSAPENAAYKPTAVVGALSEIPGLVS